MSDQRARVVALIRKNAANHEQFFETLNDPTWLEFLKNEGFFLNPPPPERGDGWVQYPSWSESRFLVRITSRVPGSVAAIVRTIPVTDNVRVHEDFLAIAAESPAEVVAEIVGREVVWLKAYEGHLMSLPSSAAGAIAHAAAVGEVDTAYALASVLLEISAQKDDFPIARRQHAVSRISDYTYGQLVAATWTALANIDTRRAFGFLCDRLQQVVEIEFGHSEGVGGMTHIARPAVEDHAQNHRHGLLDLLVDATRDRAHELAESADGRSVVAAEFSRRDSPIFQRIWLLVLRLTGSSDEVTEALLVPGALYATETWHEYGELLRERFGDLTLAQRSEVFAALSIGKERRPTSIQAERGVSQEDLDRWERRDRLKRYVLIRDFLDGTYLGDLQALENEFGAPDHPTFETYMTSWTGPVSPVTATELRDMDPVDVVRLVHGWSPPESIEGPSVEGLGIALREAVEARAADYALIATEFEDVPSTYASAVLSGIVAGVQSGTTIEWSPVLKLCEWVVAQPQLLEDRDEDELGDPRWRGARKAVAGLLSKGFGEQRSLPESCRQVAWALVEALLADSDPTPEHEGQYGGENMDFATLSINTTRGEAMHAVFRYLLWVERTGSGFDGPDSVPEVVGAINRHLDTRTEASLAVRSVYGQWFPQLVRVDHDWSRTLVELIFPLDDKASDFFLVAWETYVRFNGPYAEVYRVMKSTYAAAIERLEVFTDTESHLGDPRKRLGDHLLVLRIRGDVGPSDDLFPAFWLAAPPEVRHEVLQSAGWSFARATDVPPAAIARFMSLWEWVRVEGSSDPATLSAFGAWLGAITLDPEWLLREAIAVLGTGAYLEPDFEVYACAQRLVLENSMQVARLLRMMILNASEPWSVEGSRDEIRATLRILLRSPVAGAREEARGIVDLLGAQGMTAFLELLRET